VPAETRTWDDLEPFTGTIDGTDQVLIIASTKGGKSTLAATLTLPVMSLVAIDAKERLTLPRARVYELPKFDAKYPQRYTTAIAEALHWQKDGRNRVILRVHVLDNEDFEAHNLIFRYLYMRGDCIVWIDEITATGATPGRVQPWLRGISARGRTRGLGLWTMTQAPYGLVPGILRRNAEYMIFGTVENEDVKDVHRAGIDIALQIPSSTGRFLLYRRGEREPYRLYLPIPPVLSRWEAP